MKASEMKVGRRYRLLPSPETKTELHNALVERIEDELDDPVMPLVKTIKVGRRTGRGRGGMLVRAGDELRLLPDHKVVPEQE
jgi:hypothetical protein